MTQITPKQTGIAVTVSSAVHYLIRQIDELQGTPLFSLRIKQTGKSFLSSLEAYAGRTVWAKEVEGIDINDVSNEADTASEFFHAMLILSQGVQDVPIGQMHLFWLEMQKNFKRFDIPIRVTLDGDFELIERKEVVEL